MANEKRLIKMCDATAVYNGIALYMAENAYLNDTALDVLKMVASWLNDAPTVDAVEVVRCKDCIWFSKTGYDEDNAHEEDLNLHMGYCSEWRRGTQACRFCSYGERKENG